jgi:uncharacterized OB-fold protein
MSDDSEQENNEKSKKEPPKNFTTSRAASVIQTKCEKCGRYYYKDEVHYCG